MKPVDDTAAEQRPKTAVLKPPVLTDIQVEAFGRETGEPGWMVDSRRAAFEIYRRLDPPGAGDDSWRRSEWLRFPFTSLNLEALAVSGKSKRGPAAFWKPIAGAKTGGQLGLEDRELHTIALRENLARSGVVFQPIIQAAREHPDLIRGLLGSLLPPADGIFAALAAVIFDTGYVLHVPKGVRVAEPLHAALWSSGAGLRASRVLIDVREGASVTLFQENASPERPDPAVRLELIELNVHPGAELRFCLLQSWGANVVRMAHEKAAVAQNGRLVWNFADCGGRGGKSFSGVDLAGEGASAGWSGFHFLDGCRQSDDDTLQNHLAPRTVSDYLGKGVLAGRATARWRGMVRVGPKAAGADGYQANRTLMLSEQAVAESIPGLEILSDDVRCSHGVTVGELDSEELFYLRTRGISEPDARRLLVGGFLQSVLERIPEESVRRRVDLAVGAKMKTMELETDSIEKKPRPEARPESQGAIS
jgi:Fe-S cluster assembly protein SufD